MQNAKNTSTQKGKGAARPARILWQTVRMVHADHALCAWAVFVCLACMALVALEPETFNNFGDAFWYLFQAITTIGFGDIVVTSTLGRIITILVGLSGLFVVAVMTGVVVNYFTQRIQIAQNESFLAFGHKMERLTDLTPKQLQELQDDFTTFMKSRRM